MTGVQTCALPILPISNGEYKNGIWVSSDKTLINKKFISFSDIINNGLPDIEYKVLFNPQMLEFLNKYKTDLKTQNTPEATYIIENLYRLPYAMKEDTPYTYLLEKIYNHLKAMYQEIHTTKQENIVKNVNEQKRLLINRKVHDLDSFKNKIKEIYMSKEYPEDWTWEQLRKFCKQLGISSSATFKEELINKLEIYFNIIDKNPISRTEFLSKSYKDKGTGSWTLAELVDIADDLDIEFYEDSTRKELYDLIDKYFVAQESPKRKYTLEDSTTEDSTTTEDEAINEALNEAIDMFKKQRIE